MESYHPIFYLPRHPQTKLFEARMVVPSGGLTQVRNGWGRVCVSVVLLFYTSVCLWAAELSWKGLGFLSLSSAGHSPRYACFALNFLDTPSVEPEVSGFTWPLETGEVCLEQTSTFMALWWMGDCREFQKNVNLLHFLRWGHCKVIHSTGNHR